MNFRDSEIAVSGKTRWMLTRIVKATQPADAMESRATVDALADKIINEWLDRAHPKLKELWVSRQGVDKEAEKLIQQNEK